MAHVVRIVLNSYIFEESMLIFILFMAKSGYIDLSDECTVAEALRKYSGHKSWCTRYTNKINKSQPLLEKQ